MYLQKMVFLFFILHTLLFATTTPKARFQTLQQCQKSLKEDLEQLEKNHLETAKTVSKISNNHSPLDEYIDTIDARRETLHRSMVYDYIEIGASLKKEGKLEESLKEFENAFTLSYTILGGSSRITQYTLKSAKEDLNTTEAIKFETKALRKVIKRHKTNLEKRDSLVNRKKVYEDYKKLINAYGIEKIDKEDLENHTRYGVVYIRGMMEENKNNSDESNKIPLTKIKEVFNSLPDSPEKDKLQLEYKELKDKNDSILYLLFATLIFLVLALLYYFKIYYSPLVRKITKSPKSLLSLTAPQLKKVKRDLQILLQWRDILKLAGTTHLKVKNALQFYNKPSIEKLMKILSIEYYSYDKEKLLYLLKKINIGLNLNSFYLLLTTENLSTIKEEYLIGERIFVISHPKYQDEIAKFANNKNNNLIAPTSEELTQLLLSRDSQKILAKILANCLSFKYLSPYQTKGAVEFQNNFFGRTEIIRDITTKESTNYFLVGARQLGKSSILKALERFYKENSSVECHYFSLEYGDILQELSLALKIKKESSLEALTATIKAKEKKQIFLIDEADFLSQNAQCMQISSTFRKLSQEGDAIFIFAGFWKLYQSVTMNYHSPLKNFAELIHLNALEEDACRELMIKPMQRLNIKYENQEKNVTETIGRCGYRANLIAMICDNVLKELKGNIITDKEIRSSFSKENIYHTVNEWQGLSTNEKENRINRLIVYLTFENDYFTLSDVVEKIKEENVQLSIEEIETSLKQLSLGYVLKKEKNLYSYQIPLLKEFLVEDNNRDILLFSIVKELKNER